MDWNFRVPATHRYSEDSAALSGDLRYIILHARKYHYCCSYLRYSCFSAFGGSRCSDSVVEENVVTVLRYVRFLDDSYMHLVSSQVLDNVAFRLFFLHRVCI